MAELMHEYDDAQNNKKRKQGMQQMKHYKTCCAKRRAL